MFLESYSILIAALALHEGPSLTSSAKLQLAESQLLFLSELLDPRHELINPNAVTHTVGSIAANLALVRDHVKNTREMSNCIKRHLACCNAAWKAANSSLFDHQQRSYEFYQKHSYTVHKMAVIQGLLGQLANLE